jgi:hypothetical protein
MANGIVESCKILNIDNYMKKEKLKSSEMGKNISESMREYIFWDNEFNLLRQDLYFTASKRHLGGYRIYHQCFCGRNAVNLYRPEGQCQFRCKICYSLIYKSQMNKESLYYKHVERHENKLEKIYKQLNKKGIWRKTRERLEREYEEVLGEVNRNREILEKLAMTAPIHKVVQAYADSM